MSNNIKPGRFCTVNGIVYRAKKRTNGCHGCFFDDILSCPNVTDSRYKGPKIGCTENDIIFVKV